MTRVEAERHRTECWARFTAAVADYRAGNKVGCIAYRARIKTESGEEVASRAESEVVACATYQPRDAAEAKRWRAAGLR